MDGDSLIIFGGFTEDERQSYFSEYSVKASGIEFPEWVLYPSKLVFGVQDRAQIVSDISSRLENADSRTELGLESELSEKFSLGEDVASSKVTDETAVGLCETHQVSGNSEVTSVEKFDISGNPDSAETSSVPTTRAQVVCSEEQTFASEDNVIFQNNVVEENGPQCGETVLPAPTNVVTVGTKTMMTVSTRTVECRNEGVKSSWADLFKTKPSSKPQAPLSQLRPPAPLQQVDRHEDDELLKKDQFQQYFCDVLKKVSLTNRVPSLQPRGLKNNGNWCYINSTLQVLLFCPSFYHFLMMFKLKTERGTSYTPILDALVLFASQFSEMSQQQATCSGKSRDWGKQDVMMGLPFEPTNVYNLLTEGKTTLSQQGKQEDAEEFLSCILNGLHDEMIQLAAHGDKQKQDTSSHPASVDQAVGDWEQVGPRNRSTITRQATILKSPVAAMFGGYLRSSLVQPGVKESASIQPFFTIQLDLRGEVATVQQAFDNFFRVEEVEGFQCDKSKTEVEVSKRWTLDTLPIVLVLHLKRFVVSKNGCEKLTKKVTYEPQLQVPTDTVSKTTKVRSKNMLTYKLFAVTYHHGKNLNGGHYTSDISHPAGGWLRADDMSVRPVPPKFVFNPLSNRDPYLLYYCRGDIST